MTGYRLWLLLLLLLAMPAEAARVINSVTLDGGATTTVAPGATVTVTISVTTSGFGSNDDWDSTSYTVNGVTTCVDTPNHNGDGTYTESFTLTAPVGTGSYTISFYAHRNGGCNPGSDSNNFSVANGIVVSSGPVTPPAPILQYNFDETLWNGTAGEVADASTSGYDGTAVNGAFTDLTTPNPAIAGDPGTCRYGEFDGVNDYVAVPTAFPNQTGSFTITAWIYARDNTGDHRIFADDENNTGGYALSLGDGSNGALRFFSRNANPVSVDTPSGTIGLNTWYHIAAVHDASGNTRQIYVNGVAQSLNGGGTTSSYTGTWGTDNGPVSIGAETNASAETGSGFRFNGMIDEVRVYSAALSQAEIDAVRLETHPCSLAVVDHYEITWSGSALTCEPISVTITGHDSGDAVTGPAAGTTITLSTSTSQGLWSNPDNGTLIDNGNGDASYTFNGNSDVTLNFNHPAAGLVNFDINSGSAPNEGTGLEDPDVTFVDAGFRIVDANNNPIGSQTSAKPSPSADPQQLYLQAVRTDSNTMACVNAFAPGTEADVDFAVECVNPSTCIAGTNLSIEYATLSGLTTASLSAQDDVASPTWATLSSMLFATDSKAAIILTYPEAGQLQLHSRYEVLDGTGAGTGEYITGTSQYAVVPAGFCVEAQMMGTLDPTCDTPPLDQCLRYVAAGENFDLLVTAKAWEFDGDTDFCSVGNATTQNFASSNIVLSVTDTVTLPNPIAPAGETAATLATPAATSTIASGSGSVTESVSISEVGVFSLTATDNNYFGQSVLGESVNVGRFVPDHFAMILGSVSPGHTATAGDYSYFGQPLQLSFTLEARSVSGLATENYVDAFAKLDPASHAVVGSTGNEDFLYGAADTVTPLSFNSLLSSSASGAVWGAVQPGQLDVVALPITINKPSPAMAPVTNIDIGLFVEDEDKVTFVPSGLPTALNLNSSASGGVDSVKIDDLDGTLYYGRIYFPPVYGPEIFAGDTTVMPFEIQYFDGSIFTLNTADSFVTAGDSPSRYGAGTPMQDLSAVTSNHAGNLVAADVTANDIDFPDTLTDVINGRGQLITIARPGVGKDGTVDVTFPVESWFQYDWNSTGTDIDPTTTVTFGRYRGHDRIIYWREVH